MSNLRSYIPQDGVAAGKKNIQSLPIKWIEAEDTKDETVAAGTCECL